MKLIKNIKSKITDFIINASSKQINALEQRIEAYENQLYDIQQSVKMNSNTFEDVNYSVQELNDTVQNITDYDFDYMSTMIDKHEEIFERHEKNINHVDERISEHINNTSIQNVLDVHSMHDEIQKYGVIATLKLSKINQDE